jgi:hypothetical protein
MKQVVGYCNDDGNAMATNLDYQKKNLSQLNHEQIKRRRNTVLRSTKPCPFQFRKKVDTIGFYISLYNGSGNSYHQGHPKFDPDFMPTQLSSLTQEEIDDMTHAKNATVSNAACREVMAAKFDKYIPTAQMRYLNSLPDEGGSDEYGSLVEAFQNNPHISLNILWSIKQNSEDVVLSSTKIPIFAHLCSGIDGALLQQSKVLQDPSCWRNSVPSSFRW